MMSGVRGSPCGGMPGVLNICAMPGPQNICPIPAMLADAGDWVSSVVTAAAVAQPLRSHNSEMSSSVGPI